MDSLIWSGDRESTHREDRRASHDSQTIALGSGDQSVVDAIVEKYRSLDLVCEHITLLIDRGVDPEFAVARGVCSATSKSQLARLGFRPQQQIVPALVIPIHNTQGERVNHLSRPDRPRIKNGKSIKYETVSGSTMTIDIPPSVRADVRDVSIPLVITECPLEADSGASRRICCIALLGVWNFARGQSVLADWDNIVLAQRDVFIAFDSDVMTKPQVHGALVRLKEFLEHRQARVKIIYLPSNENGSKVGLDDFLAAGQHGSNSSPSRNRHSERYRRRQTRWMSASTSKTGVGLSGASGHPMGTLKSR